MQNFSHKAASDYNYDKVVLYARIYITLNSSAHIYGQPAGR